MACFMFTTIQPKPVPVRKSKVKNGEILVIRNPSLLNSAHHGDPMEISSGVLVSILLVIIIALSAFMLYREFKHMNERLEARIIKLEEASKKRVPYRTQEELLDAMAALDAFENEVDLGKAMINNAKAHIAKGLQVGTNREEQ